MHIKKQRLLTPGPTPLYPPALHAMMASDVHHRTDDFKKVYEASLTKLKQVMATSGDVLVFSSSGTGAMDAAVSNLFRKGDKVIVCSAGKFGERWVQIANAYGLQPVVLKKEYGDVVSPEELQQALNSNPDVRGVFLQASETSTGAQHEVEAMGRMIAKTDAIFVVDAITGFGTMPLDIDGWGLDVFISGSQKSFMIPPGLAFMAVSAKAWRHAETCDLPHFYFDLKKEKASVDKFDATWTPSTSLFLALNAALDYMVQTGIGKMVENAQMLAKATRAAAVELGLELFAPDFPAASVTAIKAPAGIDSGAIVKGYKQRFGAIIANGQGSMKGQIFRIAHLGYFDFADLFAVIAELELILHGEGFPVKFGAGVAAVQNIYAEAAIRPAVPA